MDQFFSDGFVERKIIFLHDILKLCQLRHIELKRERGKKPGKDKKAATQSQIVPLLVERHAKTTSFSSSANMSDANSHLLENEEIGMPRMVGPPAPTPLGHAPFSNSASRHGVSVTPSWDQQDKRTLQVSANQLRSSEGVSSTGNLRSSFPKPVVIQGARSVHVVSPDSDGQSFSEEDGHDYKANENQDGSEGGQDQGSYNRLFLSREALTDDKQQHEANHVCHNDSLVLRMSESILVLVERVEQLESQIHTVAELAVAAEKRASMVDKAREEGEARLTLAEGRIRMLEQRINELTCDAAVSKVYSPASDSRHAQHRFTDQSMGQNTADVSRSPHSASKITNKDSESARNLNSFEEEVLLTQTGLLHSNGRYSNGNGPEGAANTAEKADSLGADQMRSSRSSRLMSSQTAGACDEDLEKFIASITERFKETNELLEQSNEKLKRRQAPLVTDASFE